MEKALFDKLLGIAEHYMGNDDLSHGKPHVLRMHRDFRTFIKSKPSVNDAVLEALECSILLHDIGRSQCSIEKWENHSTISGNILRELFNDELFDLPHKEMVLYAVENHETGIDSSPKDDKELCLGLLTVFDVMDAIGEWILLRMGHDWGNLAPWVPKKGELPKEEIRYYLNDPTSMSKDKRSKMIKESILSCLLYIYCSAFWIVSPLKKHLDSVTKKEITRRLKVIKGFIIDSAEFTDYSFRDP